MSTRVLYWISGSAPAWRANAILVEKKLEFESKRLDASKGAIPQARYCIGHQDNTRIN